MASPRPDPARRPDAPSAAPTPRRALWATVVVLVALGVAWVGWLARSAVSKTELPTAASAASAANAASATSAASAAVASYADNQQCLGCHAEQAAAWRGSPRRPVWASPRA
jgi:hypothetical protein